MHVLDVRKPATRPFERLRKRLAWNASTRILLLFYLFNIMFCILLISALRNTQLTKDKEELATVIRRLTATVAGHEYEDRQSNSAKATLEYERAQLSSTNTALEATSAVAQTQAASTPVLPTSAPTATATSIPTPTPPTPTVTSTRMPPSPTPTMALTPTPPTPASTPTPEPGPELPIRPSTPPSPVPRETPTS